jgi:hypothetical protein
MNLLFSALTLILCPWIWSTGKPMEEALNTVTFTMLMELSTNEVHGEVFSQETTTRDVLLY